MFTLHALLAGSDLSLWDSGCRQGQKAQVRADFEAAAACVLRNGRKFGGRPKTGRGGLVENATRTRRHGRALKRGVHGGRRSLTPGKSFARENRRGAPRYTTH